MLFGVIIIIIGVVLLLDNLGYVSGGAWNIIWPAIIVILGISVLARKSRRAAFDDPEPKKEKKVADKN